MAPHFLRRYLARMSVPGSRKVRKDGPHKNNFRPRVEALEDRVTPAALTWVGDVDNLWDGGVSGIDTNWDTDTLPAPGDTLVFPDLAANKTNSNDIPGLALDQIVFSGATGGYALGGLGVTLSTAGFGGIFSANTSGTNQVTLNVTLDTAATFAATMAGGTLQVDGDVDTNGITIMPADLTVDGPGAVVLNGVVSGSGGLIKNGSGTATLTNIETYSGSTNVNAGTLVISAPGMTDPGSSVTVAGGATLAGNGKSQGPVTVNAGGHLSPGPVTAVLHTHNGLTLSPGANFDVELNGSSPGTGYDQVHAKGAVDLTGAVLHVSLNYCAAGGSTFTVIDNYGTAGSVTGTFAGLPNMATFLVPGEAYFQINYHGGDGNDVVLTRSLTATRVWKGSGLSSKWSNPINWAGGVAPKPGDTLIFPNSAAAKSNVNDFLPGTYFEAIKFTGTGYFVTGNGVTLCDGLSDTAPGANTFVPDIRLLDPVTITNTGSTFLVTGNINLNGFTLTVNTAASSPTTLQGVISGSGNVLKTGTGTLTLSGNLANTFAGTTTVKTGTLLLSKATGVTAVPGPLVVGDGLGGFAADVVRLAASDQIANTAPVTVTSSGKLDLTSNRETLTDAIGPLTLTGGVVTTSPTMGLLNLNGDVTATAGSAINGNVALNAVLRTFTVSSGTLTLNGQLQGTGGIVKNGPGTLKLTGNTENLYTGATVLNAGTLLLAKTAGNAVQGPLVVGDGFGPDLVQLTRPNQIKDIAPVIVNAGGTLDLFGQNDALGSLTLADGTVKTGAGLLTLNGNLTSSGLSTVTGKVTIREVTRVVNVTGGTLTVSATIDGFMGAGLWKQGPGTLVFAAANTYPGLTAIQAGTVIVNGKLAGPVEVDSLGNLRGTGSTGDVFVNGGVVFPGSLLTAGVLKAHGDVEFTPASTYQVRLTAAGNDRLEADGAADLNGCTLSLAVSFVPSIGASFTILKAADGVFGTFAGLPNGFTVTVGGMDFTVSYLATSVVLTRVA